MLTEPFAVYVRERVVDELVVCADSTRGAATSSAAIGAMRMKCLLIESIHPHTGRVGPVNWL
jgi:hypothetical protein